MKLILDGPKYLFPLVDGIDFLSLSILANDPEKLIEDIDYVLYYKLGFNK